MGNIVTSKVTVRGTRALFQHMFGPDAIPLEKQEKTGVAGNDPFEWRKTCMVTRQGQLYIMGSYAFSAMKEAAKYTKRGKASLQSPLVATLQVLDDRILLDRWFPGFPSENSFDPSNADEPSRNADDLVYLDVRSVVNPSTKGRNVRYRLATSPGWQCSFTLQFDKTIVSRPEMEAVCHDAGALVGLANGRKIGMGRFEVIEFSEG